MSFGPVALATAAIFKGGASLYAQKQASDAAKAQAKSQQLLLDRRAVAASDAMRENSSRMRKNKARTLAEVRVQQAMAGFANTGTPLAVFGEIGSQYDEQINSITDRSLNQISDYRAQSQMIGFADKQRQKNSRLNMFGTLINTAGSAGVGYKTGYDETAKDPFSIFS